MDPPLLCGSGMDPDRGMSGRSWRGARLRDARWEFGSQCRGHVPLRDLGLSVAVHDHTGDRCGGVLRVCRDLHTHTAAAARSAAILPVVPRRRSAPTRCAAGSAAPTTGGAAVDRPDVVLARWVEDRAMSRLMGGREPTGEGRVESVIVARRWDGESGRTGASFRRKRPRNHSVNITVYVITVQTPGLLSRGSQVRILPGAPFS